MRRFYEFFAGGGMARLGLGDGWSCLFANDFDKKKCATYLRNGGGSELHQGDVAHLTTDDLPGPRGPGLGFFPLSGSLARRFRSGARR